MGSHSVSSPSKQVFHDSCAPWCCRCRSFFDAACGLLACAVGLGPVVPNGPAAGSTDGRAGAVDAYPLESSCGPGDITLPVGSMERTDGPSYLQALQDIAGSGGWAMGQCPELDGPADSGAGRTPSLCGPRQPCRARRCCRAEGAVRCQKNTCCVHLPRRRRRWCWPIAVRYRKNGKRVWTQGPGCEAS